MYDYPCQMAIQARESIDEGLNRSIKCYKCVTTSREVRAMIDWSIDQDVDMYIERIIKSELCGKCTYLHMLQAAQKYGHPLE